MDNLKFLSVNVRGLNTKEKRLKLFNWLKYSKTDIVFLQETHFTEENESLYNFSWYGKIIHCFSDSTFSRGVSILTKNGLDINILNTHRSNDGRKLLINVKLNDVEFTLVNIYAPNNETHRIQFFKRLRSFINNYSNISSKIILCGDFNCKIDNCTDKSSKILNDVITQLNLIDLWASKYDKNNGFTWCDASNTPKSRIDFVFISKNLLNKSKSPTLQKIPGTHSNGTRMSDHKAIRFNMNMNDNTRGTGYWKLNISHLQSSEYKNQIVNIIQNIKSSRGTCIQKWEDLKHKVKQFSIHFSIRAQNKFKNRISVIEKEINEIESLPHHQIDMNKKRDLESQLNDLYNKKAKGAQIRSRAKWVDEGEKNTKYFLNLEKNINRTMLLMSYRTNRKKL